MDNNYIQHDYKDSKIESVNGNFKDSGVIIGGCLDCLKDIIGTKYDNTKKFIEKYKDKKIIWYFDIFAMSSVNVYLTLLQLKLAGWFKYSNTFIFGTVRYETIYADISYEDAIKKALKEYEKYRVIQDNNYVSDFDKLLKEAKQIENK